MKAFKVEFDGKKFVKVTFEVDHEFDFSHDPEVNLDGLSNSHNCDEHSIDKFIDQLNEDLVQEFDDNTKEDEFIVKQCRDCGKYFTLNYGEFMWFKNRNLSIPVRCCTCRAIKKLKL